MTDTPKGSDPAFPVPGHHYAKGEERREDFAKFAMMGLLASELTQLESPEWVADQSVAYADALIAALAKQ